MALTNKLSAIGDAIREKTGKSELLTLDAMPGEIASIETGGGGSIEVEPIVLGGDCSYSCGGALAEKYIELFGNTITTKNINSATYMFERYDMETIPFDINFVVTSSVNMSYMFESATKLKELPKMSGMCNAYNMNNMFRFCQSLNNIPEDYFDELDFSQMKNATSAYSYNASRMFYDCKSLRNIPISVFNNMNPQSSYSYNYFYNGFAQCYSLDELKDLPLPYTATYTSNLFNETVRFCCRLKNMTFKVNEDNSPLVKSWKSQTIDFSTYVGYVQYNGLILDYNSGITADKEVYDDATYQALKDDPDWYTLDINYSRYNHDSAVNTINTLPDTSSYLATAGGTNTIKFKGAAGAYTDGGAINTLTEEEIAVATAKGWTVSMV